MCQCNVRVAQEWDGMLTASGAHHASKANGWGNHLTYIYCAHTQDHVTALKEQTTSMVSSDSHNETGRAQGS